MSLVHALLLFVGGPAVVLALCYLLAYVTSRDTASAGTYKLGEEWHQPLWFVGHPREGAAVHRPAHAIEAGPEHAPSATMVGGASGTW
ncbi:aa3-type cytochrome oxidase subunit CtaJ [Cumulibacter manganitolerans]|uniref:aa3-type cytochrome oxidase subunit CtaJ n=1 Tax=Cumulibacter manganitolerans TaxID=1884992 RepID=UPI0012972633|nr:hypothetical protein [Cumulibacter manganitolerans]